MPLTRFSAEPYQISERFYRAMMSRSLSLRVDALGDELAAAALQHPDQLRRHRLLIQAQRDEAERLRDFLARTSIRTSAQLDPTG